MTGYDHFPIQPNEFSEPAATRHPPLEVPDAPAAPEFRWRWPRVPKSEFGWYVDWMDDFMVNKSEVNDYPLVMTGND